MIGLFDEPSVAWVRVAVERGVDRYPDGLSYGVPSRLLPLDVGSRVTVPLGRGDTPTPGWVIDVEDDPPTLPGGDVKQVHDRDEASIALPEDLVELARWMSRYYVAPIGLTLASMLPAPVRRQTGLVTRTLVDLAPQPPPDVHLTTKQQHVRDTLAALDEIDRPIEIPRLMRLSDLGSRGPIDRLVAAGVLLRHRVTRIEADWFHRGVDDTAAPSLTAQQETITTAIGAQLGKGYSCHLLHGVTGAGKTEVYLRLIEAAIADGGAALVLVPEISLTPQTAARLMGRFPGKRIAILHSALTAAQRHHQWSMVARGEADIVLGARSAVFAPFPPDALRLVIVDEEHDYSYKQDQAPRYHGRDVAIRRAWALACPVVLGSATPALESWCNATLRGRSTLHELPVRAPGLVAPRVELVDMRRERSAHEGMLSRRLESAMHDVLADEGQVLLLLNRRGFAPYIACASIACGWMLRCEHCDASMVHHRRGHGDVRGFVRCHHCQQEQRMPTACPDCQQQVVRLGAGTQRVEAVLRDTLAIEPQRIARLDADTRRSARDLHGVLDRFHRGEIRVLLGTQMISKGLDCPGVRLVGVLDADTAIDLPDFRASERTFQLVSQVCGRCGRSEGAATAIVQTWNPHAPAIALAAAGDFTAFASRELELRTASQLPPMRRMTRLVVRDDDAATAAHRASVLADRLRSMAGAGVEISDPGPCALARIGGRHRYDLHVLAPQAASIGELLDQGRASGAIRPGRDLVVDVDPMSLL